MVMEGRALMFYKNMEADIMDMEGRALMFYKNMEADIMDIEGRALMFYKIMEADFFMLIHTNMLSIVCQKLNEKVKVEF